MPNPTNDPTKFTLPPQPLTLPTIADALTANGVSWKNYSGGRGTDGSATAADYCGICGPLTGFTSIMTTPLKTNLQDVNSLYADIKAGTVPSVAFVRPLEQLAGHPATRFTPFTRTLSPISSTWSTISLTFGRGPRS